MTQRAAPLLTTIWRGKKSGLPLSRFPAFSAKNEFQGRKVTYQVKLLLQFFISVIDAKLFKAVHIKGFKAEMQLNKLKCNLEDIYINSQYFLDKVHSLKVCCAF